MAQQNALFLSGVNGDWFVGERATPKPGPGELLIRIESTALNPVDWKASKYPLPFLTELPAVLGTDSAGTVEEVGEGVSAFQVGDKVFHQGYFTNDLATFQQFTRVPAEITAKIPPNLSVDEASSIPLGLATAALGLFTSRPEGVRSYVPPWSGGIGKYSGESIVIFGGSSSVGQYSIQLAKLAGFSPIITTASLHNAPFLKSLGATHVVDRSTDVRAGIADVLRKTGAPAPQVVYDAISEASTQAAAWDVLAPGGQLDLVLPEQVDREKYKDKHVFGVFGTVHVPQNREEGVKLYSKLTEWFGNGTLKPNRVEVLPDGLRGIIGGLKRMEENKVSGIKLIARPQESA